MAYKNKLIKNNKTGQEILFLQTAKETNGLFLEMETCYEAASKEPPSHYHPYQYEDFTVLEGELTVKLKGGIKKLKAGESLHLPPNTVHAMWNASAQKTRVNWKVAPALNTEHFLETAMGIAANEKTNKEGRPSLLQVALLATQFSTVFRLVKPAYFIQRVIFFVLAPFAYLSGYRSTYKNYLD